MTAVQPVRLPDFFLLGAAKSGTTSLDGYLRRHPGVYLSTPKEPEYFSDPKVLRRGLGWYGGLFASARADQMCGDASTTYTRWPWTCDSAELIHRHVPSARFIYLMRHPVDRMYSHYAHEMRSGVTETFEEALARRDLYRDVSRYLVQLSRYFERFPRERFLLLTHDDLRLQPEVVLDQVQDFLGLARHDLLSAGTVEANVGGSEHYVRGRTTLRLRRLPGGEALRAALPAQTRDRLFDLVLQSPLGARMGKEAEVPRMEAATRRRLIDETAEDITALETLLGRDLSAWRK